MICYVDTIDKGRFRYLNFSRWFYCKKIEDAKGKIYQFLHNYQSNKLITDHGFAGKTMVVVGKIYPEANIERGAK